MNIKENKNMNTTNFSIKAKQLIDDIKGVCVNAGLGGDAGRLGWAEG
jgi:hypothetical protein